MPIFRTIQVSFKDKEGKRKLVSLHEKFTWGNAAAAEREMAGCSCDYVIILPAPHEIGKVRGSKPDQLPSLSTHSEADTSKLMGKRWHEKKVWLRFRGQRFWYILSLQKVRQGTPTLMRMLVCFRISLFSSVSKKS